MNIQMSMSPGIYSEEFRRHWSDVRESFEKFRQWRAPWALVLVLVLGAMAFGYIRGQHSGISFMSQIASRMEATKSMYEAEAEARGDLSQVQASRKQAVDRLVRWHSPETSTEVLSPMFISDLLAGRVFMGKGQYQEGETTSLKQRAEMRLKLLPPPSADTLAELKKRHLEDMLEGSVSLNQDLAQAYSRLLGREIKPEQLVTDAELRERIKYFDKFGAR